MDLKDVTAEQILATNPDVIMIDGDNAAEVRDALLTASVVAVSGTIGWIGLVIPHFSRLFVGHDNTRSIPVSLFLGACFMLLIDTVERTLPMAELPLSIVASFIGAPLYAWLLDKQKMRCK